MTLLRKESFNIIKKLRRAGIDAKLIVLEASHQTVHDRILSRGEKEDCWCMQNIDLSSSGTSALPGIHVSTNDKSMQELSKFVLDHLE